MVRSLSNAKEVECLLVVQTEPSFGDLQVEAITGWAAGLEKRFNSAGREDDIGSVATEQESVGTCCARIGAEEVGPEVARSRGEEGNGVA